MPAPEPLCIVAHTTAKTGIKGTLKTALKPVFVNTYKF